MVVVIGCGAAPTDPSSRPEDAGPSPHDATAIEAAGEDAKLETATSGEDAPAWDDATDALVVIPAAFTEENAPMRMLQSGDAIDLHQPPQGGQVVLLAAQVRNMSTRAATILVRMRRPETGFIVAEEKRTVAMVPVPEKPRPCSPICARAVKWHMCPSAPTTTRSTSTDSPSMSRSK